MDFKQATYEQSESGTKKERHLDSEAMKELRGTDVYNKPLRCGECGGALAYKGVGEYKCRDCGALVYDDYGKVRNYVEKHIGATAAEVSEVTGVSQRAIRTMLKESKLEVAPDSKDFLRCEKCGVSIRHGRFCPKCEVAYNRRKEAEAKSNKKNVTGYGKEETGQAGAKRFNR